MKVLKWARGTPEERFWHYVDKGDPDQCWLWHGYVNKKGYGSFGIAARNHVGAHRFSYQIHHGPIPNGHVVRHMCHTPACVNPAHLKTGTQKDNLRDMVEAGRSMENEKNHLTKFPNDVIARVRASKESTKLIAQKFGISKGYVRDLRRGEYRKSIKPAKQGD